MQAEGKALIKEEIDSEDVAEVVSKWTGIPVRKMLASVAKNCCIWKRNCISAS